MADYRSGKPGSDEASVKEAERRGKLAADQPGQYVFTDPDDYVETLRSLVRRSGLTDKGVAAQSDGLIKSPSTIHALTDGKFDRKTGEYRRTRSPFLKTAIGINQAVDYAVAFIPRVKK
jgi:hypothetical protein